VHDWLYGGGAELVVEQLHKLYPEAPIYASFATRDWRKRLDGKVITGYLGWWPFNRLYKFLGPLRILWYTHLTFKDYDLVISSSGAEAKGIHVPQGTVHINYCHAPTHYYWSRYDQYMRHPGLGPFDWLGRIGLKLLVRPLRKWDYKAAQRPDYIIANSTHIQAEIKKYYGRDSTIIHPPVYMERFQKPQNQKLPRRGFLIAGRQTPYKRFDIAVQACNQLEELLTVIGEGPDQPRLRKLAGHDIKAGGALDYVLPGKSGEFFDEPTPESLAAVLKNFKPERYSHGAIAVFARRFSADSFRKKMQQFVAEHLKNR
jgi:glycosyltransferase involved in cell wall biosynthesis